MEFPYNLSGLAPTKYLSDELLSDASGVYQEAQSVMAKVIYRDGVCVCVGGGGGGGGGNVGERWEVRMKAMISKKCEGRRGRREGQMDRRVRERGGRERSREGVEERSDYITYC